MASELDRIEKRVVLRASRERVWRALSRAEEFGAWFGMRVDGEFEPHSTVRGRMVPTQVDAEVAAQQKPFEGMSFDLFIERIEPMRLFSFRWHPGADPDMGADAPTTLVTFELADAEEGTLLTVTESGFDQIPIERRAQVFRDNEGGWEIQTRLIAKYLARAQE